MIEKYIKIRKSLLKSNKPLCKNISPKIHNCFKKLNINLINKTKNILNLLIKLGKDALEKSEQSGIVYEIGCKGCDSVYIGQSKRKLNVRVNEHKRDVKNKDKKSALANHVIDTKHKIKFKKVKILDREVGYKKRLLSEMINIHFTNHTPNRDEDTNKLKREYKNTIDLIKKRLA